MTAPVPEWGTCRIRGQWVDLTGNPIQGRVTFTASPSVLLAVESQKIILPVPRTVDLDSFGRIDVVLPATDDPDINPVDWTYTVQEIFTAAKGRTYSIAAPVDGDLNLVSVAPGSPSNGSTIIVGPKGDKGDAGDFLGERITVAEWEATRPSPYFLAHRGSGDIYPENSLEAFEHAIRSGATAMEVSCGMTADGHLVVMHDLNFDRTTNATGPVSSVPSTALPAVRITKMTQTGSWTADNAPRVVLLEDVFRRYGGQVVMFLEAKLDAAYPAMMELVERYGLQDYTVVKAFYTSGRIAAAKAAGYKVFGYFGTKAEMTAGNIDSLVQAGVDYLGVPYFDGNILTPMPDEVVASAVDTGIPVLMYPLHRRCDVAPNAARGVAGFITSGYGYVNTHDAITTRDAWWSGRTEPGQLTLDQSGAAYAPKWVSPNVLRLDRVGRHFISLGQMSPLDNATGSYQIDFEACWSTLPADLTTNLTLAFGRVDDEYYEHQYAHGNGYHAVHRPNGQLQLYSHVHGSAGGTQLGSTATTAAAGAGTWMQFRLNVTPTGITWQRLDSAGSVTSTNTDHRGGYLHIGKSSTDGVLDFRNFVIT
ncbi:glycerophosphodiester phosphodiesterase family protein [Saccharopolyspora erythraea]|uniref:glycerophosphodiester phosphodiesterase n=1 Tax=Saccharopolyspora erythraea TaxID=1836 RepID=UPI001BA4C052|nr:glycerophosphodiester phosphodiesterase family protein [Saccharopolyspora erythraea]QUH01458.1 glycerophosphodiester phosphodiesterase family protein [Saccharopolyspora erythraea]